LVQAQGIAICEHGAVVSCHPTAIQRQLREVAHRVENGESEKLNDEGLLMGQIMCEAEAAVCEPERGNWVWLFLNT
jgi:hypothetical protein